MIKSPVARILLWAAGEPGQRLRPELVEHSAADRIPRARGESMNEP